MSNIARALSESLGELFSSTNPERYRSQPPRRFSPPTAGVTGERASTPFYQKPEPLTPQEEKHFKDVLEAYNNGEKVQWLSRSTPDRDRGTDKAWITWVAPHEPQFKHNDQWRIFPKPEPEVKHYANNFLEGMEL